MMSEVSLKKKKSMKIPTKSHAITEYLRDSFGGRSKTYFCFCLNPLPKYANYTVSILRNAIWAKSICTNPSKIEFNIKIYEK